MKNECKIGFYACLIWLLACSLTVSAVGVERHKPIDVLADSIIRLTVNRAADTAGAVREYNAQLYIKGQVNVRKKNVFYHQIPGMFHVSKNGQRRFFIETLNQVHFTSPDIYDQKTEGVLGTTNSFFEGDGRLSDLFHITPYNHMLLQDKLISPLSPKGDRYYIYTLDSVYHVSGKQHYKVSFKPRVTSYQLVEGYLIITNGAWSVREMYFEGRNEMLRFQNTVTMGWVDTDTEMLPMSYRLKVFFHFMGNRIDGDYSALMTYRDISHEVPHQTLKELRKQGLDKYDLTRYYNLRGDNTAPVRDMEFFQKRRPISLTGEEIDLYSEYVSKQFHNALDSTAQTKRKSRRFWNDVGDAMVSRSRFFVRNVGNFRISPIFNPQLLGYSHHNGISYKMDLRFTRRMVHDRVLEITPRLGYNFKHKEFYWLVRGYFDYWPEKRASWHFEVGNGDKVYNNEVLKDIEATSGEKVDLSEVNLEYFNHTYAKISHSWEVFNGFTLDLGLNLHRRSATGNRNEDYNRTYKSFAPMMRVSFTPGQYYYMDGARKVNLHSSYPTFIFEWEKGIGGVWKNSTIYDRFEVDVQDDLPLGLQRTLYLRFGAGTFAYKDHLYFIDFERFRRHNLPIGWSDDIGGVFHLLQSDIYNSSRQYLRLHATYQAPFLVIPHVAKYLKYVMNERIYFNTLFLPNQKPYYEVGYGIGTHLFDFGFFMSFASQKKRQFGFKLTFEIFNR
ncbi:MAG: hypothetical protein IJT46_07730 [Bacteroidaceae bacterium]|nr:hypothetical protein [Bacteroidaceae bacterium]MBQ8008482.1 hypothetical protein [Bacteroidaceae bacterium]